MFVGFIPLHCGSNLLHRDSNHDLAQPPRRTVGETEGWSRERDLPRIPTTKQEENWGQSLGFLTLNPVLPPVQQGADMEGSCPLSSSSASLILCIKRQLRGQDRAEHGGSGSSPCPVEAVMT